jgi:predicted ribosomally synthesized peptide with SipW-like signal peptide
MKRIIISLVLTLLVSAAAYSATMAYFSDNETSTGNTFTAGTLDLNVDGGNTNVVKFTVSNMRPGNQPKGKFTLANVGSINGYLDLESIAVIGNENTCIEPETEAGDITCGDPNEGELDDVVNVRLFEDNDGDGWIGTGETVFYDGKVKDLPANFERNLLINAGSTKYITAIFDWWSTTDDNKAMGDDMTLDITFELAQNTTQ